MNDSRKYKVENKFFQFLADARDYAESIMAGRHDNDSVGIFIKDGEDFFEPYGEIVRERGRFVLKR